MATVNRYEIYCIDEQIFVSSWGTSPPTKCSNNTSHNVNPYSVNIAGSINEKKVSINCENIPSGSDVTSGLYKCDSIVMLCEPNKISTIDVALAMPICVNTVEFNILGSNCGDLVTVTASPNTVIDITTVNISQNSKTFNISSHILAYLLKGYYLKLMNDSDSNNIIIDELGQIVSTDATNSTVTTKAETYHTFPIGSKFLIERKIIDNFYMNQPGVHQFGSAIIGSSYVPANTTTRIYYENKTSDIKRFVVYYEYYY